MADTAELRHDHHGCRLCVRQRADAADTIERLERERDEARARADELRRFIDWTTMSPPISVKEHHPWEAPPDYGYANDGNTMDPRQDQDDSLVEILDGFLDAYPEDIFPTPPPAEQAVNAAVAHVMRRLALPVFAECRDRIATQAAEIERLRTQAAEDIIWMSGPVSTPAADLAAWHEIQDRWLPKATDDE